MIRQMRHGEEDQVRRLIANLDYENQVFWRKQAMTLEGCLTRSSRIPIREEIKGKNIILVAEEGNMIVGLCWCTIVDRGVDKQGEIAEFYVANEFRGKGVGKELMTAAKQVFIDEHVEVAFVWTHHDNISAVKLYEDSGFKEVTQLVMAFVPPDKDKT
jgi:ribosomal protein S18 acetylase RimI-like enzyme